MSVGIFQEFNFPCDSTYERKNQHSRQKPSPFLLVAQGKNRTASTLLAW